MKQEAQDEQCNKFIQELGCTAVYEFVRMGGGGGGSCKVKPFLDCPLCPVVDCKSCI